MQRNNISSVKSRNPKLTSDRAQKPKQEIIEEKVSQVAEGLRKTFNY